MRDYGFLRATAEARAEVEHGRPARIYYTVTKKGTRVLRALLKRAHASGQFNHLDLDTILA